MKRILRIITILSFMTMCIALGYNLPVNDPKCVEVGTVTKILSLNYRDATIETSNGKTIVVNQATLKPGDSICTKRESKN